MSGLPSSKWPDGRFAAVPAIVLTLAMAAATIVLPLDRRLAMEIFLVFAMAQGWNLLCGYTGLLSFGHQAFVGIGAYSLFMAVNMLGVSPYLALLFSAGVSAGVAIVIALLLQGSRDAYFSIGIWVLANGNGSAPRAASCSIQPISMSKVSRTSCSGWLLRWRSWRNWEYSRF
jgi:hypothetical protein